MLRGTVEQQAGEGHIQGQVSRCSGLTQQGGCNAGPGRQTKWDLGSRMLFEGAEKGSQEVKGQGLHPSPSAFLRALGLKGLSAQEQLEAGTGGEVQRFCLEDTEVKLPHLG